MYLFLLSFVTTLVGAKSTCLVLPTEISYSVYSYQCEKDGYPDNFQCPYSYPYAEEIMQQPRRIYNNNGFRISCESTKVCCTTAQSDDSLPNNKKKLNELMIELKESNNPKHEDTIEKIESILNPISPISKVNGPMITSKDVSIVMFILISTIVVISGMNFIINA